MGMDNQLAHSESYLSHHSICGVLSHISRTFHGGCLDRGLPTNCAINLWTSCGYLYVEDSEAYLQQHIIEMAANLWQLVLCSHAESNVQQQFRKLPNFDGFLLLAS